MFIHVEPAILRNLKFIEFPFRNNGGNLEICFENRLKNRIVKEGGL